MRQHVLPLLTLTLMLSFTACQQADQPAPLTAPVSTEADQSNAKMAKELGQYIHQPEIGLSQANARVALRPLTPNEVWNLFKLIDLDQSGQLSDREIVDFLAKYRVRATEEQARQLIKMFDANNSGLMEFNEFERLLAEIYKL